MGMGTVLETFFLVLLAPCLTADQSLTHMFSYQLETCDYLSLCPSPANSTIQHDQGQQKSCCEPCSCSSDCVSEGTCCPAAKRSNQSSRETDGPIARHTECLSSLLLPVERVWTRQFSWYFMVSSCPESFSDSDVSSQCRQRNLSNVDEVTPVYSSRTGRIYANQYCSLCHGEEEGDLLQWDISLVCRSHSEIEYKYQLNMSFINPERLTTKQFVQRVIAGLLSDSITMCNIAYEPPSALSHLKCASQESSETEKCSPNVVIRRFNFDPFLDECAFYRVAYDDESPGIMKESVHKMVLCFVCLGWSDADVNDCDLYLTYSAATPFSISLNYRDKVDTPISNDNKCNDSEVYDPFKDLCRIAICPLFSGPPFCHFMARKLPSPIVKFHLRLVPSSDVPPTLAKTDGAVMKALEDVRRILLQNGADSFLSDVGHIGSWYKATVKGNVSIVDFIFITVEAQFNGPFYMQEMYKWLDNVTRHMSPLVLAGVTHTLEIDNRVYEEKWFRFFVTNILYNGKELIQGGVFGPSSNGRKESLLVNRFYFCPQVELGSNEFQLTGNEIIVRLSKDITVKLDDYYITSKFNNDSVRVCIDDLLNIQKSGTSTSFAHDPRPEVHIFALVLCSIVSICLRIGYEFRYERYISYGDRQNLALAFYNIIVEISFALAKQPFKPSPLTFCRVVGLLNHFLGLHFIFMLSVCAYYTCRQSVLISQGSTQPLKYIPLLIALLSTGSLSGIFVSVSVFVSLMQSGATEIGYGTEGCFLSSLATIVSTFILPAGVSIVFSIVCLTLALICLLKSGKWRQRVEGSPVYQRAAMLLLMAILCLVVVMLASVSLLSGHQGMRMALDVLVAGYGIWCLCLRLLVSVPIFCTGSAGHSGS